MLLQTLLALLGLAVMTAGVAVSIRYITKWRRRVEQTDPERDEKAEKDRQRMVFVTKNLKTRVWTMVLTPRSVPAETQAGGVDEGGTTPNGVNLGVLFGADDGQPAADDSSARPAAHPAFVLTAAPPRSPNSRRTAAVRMMNRSINSNNDNNLDSSNHSSSTTSSDGELLDSATSSDVTASSSSSTTSSRHGLDLEAAGCGGCDQSGVGSGGGAESASHQQLSSSTLSLHNKGSGECAICSRTFRHGRDVVCDSNNNSCRHVFHASCMKRWLLLNPNCPLCRHEYLLHFAPKWRAALVPAPAPLLPSVPESPKGASPRRSPRSLPPVSAASTGDAAVASELPIVPMNGTSIAAPALSADYIPSEELALPHPVATAV
jgi:Ring finger domain